MVCVDTPARSFSSARSSISSGGVSSMNWTNGSIVSEYWIRCGIGIVTSPLRKCGLSSSAGFTLSMDAAPPGRLLLGNRHRNSGDFYIDRAEMVAAGEIEGFPVGAAKGQICRGRGAVDDAAEFFALWIDDPQPTGAAAIDIAFDVDLHAVGNAGFIAAQIDKHMIAVFRERAVGRDIEGANVAAARVVDVEHALVGRKGESVGHDEIVDQQCQAAEVRSYPVDP